MKEILSRVYTRQHVARQHVAFNILLVAGNMLPSNMLPGVSCCTVNAYFAKQIRRYKLCQT